MYSQNEMIAKILAETDEFTKAELCQLDTRSIELIYERLFSRWFGPEYYE